MPASMHRRILLLSTVAGLSFVIPLHRAFSAPVSPAPPAAVTESAEAPSDEADAEPADDANPDSLPAAGHSFHGEAFDEGPRQAATLMPGMSNVVFASSAQPESTQSFVNQGVALLHGFAYLEAERSFRQAAKEQPDLAIAYWGMAMANVNNAKRAGSLIAEAMERKAQASVRERLYIEAADRWLGAAGREKENKQKDDAKKKELRKRREQRYIEDLEKILHDFPDDVDAKAFLALQLWQADRNGVPLVSYYAVDALLGEVFQANPMHPAHHYRIHLWDSRRASNALQSAALCGPSMPGVAHMWHMPGHIYSRLHRYADAAWQQEASARVDHAHMIRTRILPDQIHNFAHNNEWLTRNLLFLGRVDEALDQARNLVAMPQHPKYNTLEKRGSYQYGRQRLLQSLTEFALWDQLIDEAAGPYLAPTDDRQLQNERLAWLAVAHYQTGAKKQAGQLTRQLKRRRLQLQTQLLDRAEQPSTDDAKPAAEADANANADASAKADDRSDEELRKELGQLRELTALCTAAAAAVRGRGEMLEEQLKKAGEIDAVLQAQWLAQAGNRDKALEVAEKAVKDKPAQVRPLAVWIDLLWQSEEDNHRETAVQQFSALRKLAADADPDLPLLERLAPVAKAAGVDGDWRIAYEPPGDLGERPPLDDLGPFRWRPYTAPLWTAVNSDGTPISSDAYQGRPTIVIFYLGFGCLHCVEQLHAFEPHIAAFEKAGISVVGISTETAEQLRLGMKNLDDPLSMPLLADPELQAFKGFRCYDDFEQQPLHGTFLIDAAGNVRWQDISYEPFTDAEFLIQEAPRLLSLDQ